jgi:uncharacterized protein
MNDEARGPGASGDPLNPEPAGDTGLLALDEGLGSSVVASPEPAVPLPIPRAEPVEAMSRIAAVDVLRGVALLGILAMNIVSFGWPFSGYENPKLSGGDGPANRAAWVVNSLIFSGKMMSLFSMLFGAGLVLMSERAEARGVRVRGVYYRRVLWLLVFGLIHAYLIWEGDILVAYALCGLVLYLFRNKSPRTLIGLGVVLLAIASLLGVGFVAFARVAERASMAVAEAKAAGRAPPEVEVGFQQAWDDGLREFFRPTPEETEKDLAAYRGSYAEVVRHRAPLVLLIQTFAFAVMVVWGVAGRMLIGMALMKLGVFTAGRSWRFYRGMAVISYAFGLPLTLYGIISLLRHDFDPLVAMGGATAFGLGMVPMALGHAAVVMMACKAQMWPGARRRLGAVGRMALTNYLAQSLLCTTLFYGYGLGYFGYLDRVWLWGVVLAIWALQLWYSPLWLERFRFGPAEWLWRSLTYGRFQPMRLESKTTPLAG